MTWQELEIVPYPFSWVPILVAHVGHLNGGFSQFFVTPRLEVSWNGGTPKFSYPTMNFLSCAITAVSDMFWFLYMASWDPAHCSFATHHLSHTALSHTIFHTQLSHTHTRSFTQNFVTYTIFFVAHHLTLSRTTLHIQLVLLLDPPPHPLSFLPSPSPLQHLLLLLIIGRSWLVGLSGPLVSIIYGIILPID